MSAFVRKWLNRIEIKPNRWVYIPTPGTKADGRKLVKVIKNRWNPPAYFYHFKKGGHIAALNAHRKSVYFSRIDIEDFFGSITASRITRTLKPYFGYDKAREIAKNSTVRRPDSQVSKLMVPFGFVQSSLIASVCLDKSTFGEFLKGLSTDPNFVLSVYMDDIIISSNNKVDLANKTHELKKFLVKSHWASSQKKELIAQRAITAFNIDLMQNLIEVCDSRLQKFKADYLQSGSTNKKSAIIAYIKTVNEAQLSELFDEEGGS